jgi:tetratricopeptide (TPR) repeat protein
VVAAVLVGAAIGVVIARRRARHRSFGVPPKDVAGVLRAYRHGHYEQVVASAPDVVASMGAVTGAVWRSRLELVWGHSLFELDRYEEAVVHLQRGLDESPAPPEASARFAHCLGYALQVTGRADEARQTYERLLADPDLDPTVRTGVERNLAELRAGGSAGPPPRG